MVKRALPLLENMVRQLQSEFLMRNYRLDPLLSHIGHPEQLHAMAKRLVKPAGITFRNEAGIIGAGFDG